jgi:tRNA dimethylallyltransferase
VEDTRPLIIVLGPTGSGKSELALDIAEKFDGEIVNCDSLQLYRMFDIGTAKLPESQRRGIPHYLIDASGPLQVFTAGEYVRQARPILREISGRGRLPVVVGGTGFYLRALLHGLFAGPERDEALRARLLDAMNRRPGFLHRALRLFDPQAGRRIHPNDANKLIRALEVCISAQTPMTDLFETGRQPLEGFRPLKIGINSPRAALFSRLDERCRQMWDGGLIGEVAKILDSGIPESAKPFESIGYKQALDFHLGRSGEAEALEEMQRETRRYAKRQMTWFRREPEVCWFDGFGGDQEVRCEALNSVYTHLDVVP